MKAGILAALPWVLCAVAVAILCVRLGSRRGETGKKLDQRLALGMALGLLLAPMLNQLHLWENHGIGLAQGPMWGMALAALFGGRGDSGGAEEN